MTALLFPMPDTLRNTPGAPIVLAIVLGAALLAFIVMRVRIAGMDCDRAMERDLEERL
jgi:hypothetical protein